VISADGIVHRVDDAVIANADSEAIPTRKPLSSPSDAN
jgi:hypothetical protein